jgi:hypothetical protein
MYGGIEGGGGDCFGEEKTIVLVRRQRLTL